jgi:hypothetical protein
MKGAEGVIGVIGCSECSESGVREEQTWWVIVAVL